MYLEGNKYQVKRLTVTLPAGERQVSLSSFNQTFWGNSKKIIGFILLGQEERDATTDVFLDKNTDISSFILNIQQDNTTLANGLPLQQMLFNDGNFIDKQFYHYVLEKNRYEESTIENLFHDGSPTTVTNRFFLGVVFEC